MKKLLFLIFSIIIVSCSSEGSENDNSNKSYEYKVKRVLGGKVNAQTGIVPAPLWTVKQFSYTVDTLEIDLNADPFPSYPIEISIEEYDDASTKAPSSVKSHVNYINFINLKANWSDNAIRQIFLFERYSTRGASFTYSESNLNLSDYPELFIDNKNIPSYFNLEIKDKIGDDLESISTNIEYEIGEEIFYNGLKFRVISKK